MGRTPEEEWGLPSWPSDPPRKDVRDPDKGAWDCLTAVVAVGVGVLTAVALCITSAMLGG